MRLGNVLEMVARVESGQGEGEGSWIDGRMVCVLAGGTESPAKYTAAGVSYVPAGITTAPHTHEAEEIAYVVSGSGVIEIDGSEIAVNVGDVVLVKSGLPHRTWASETESLGVFWTYAPPESVIRWLESAEKGR
ncbi:MAG: cupin domain-containing protein [Actinobacteria bacterium]|nr:cupin domain-containing protein [Actinomycetota bacterium]